MKLLQDDISELKNAIDSYDFPCVCYDFLNNRRIVHNNMLPVEEFIKSDFISADPELVKNGLSNVLYWGYNNIGYRDTRVNRFRNEVTEEKLLIAAQLFSNILGNCLRKIKEIQLPEFSGMSFITKVRMFLNPVDYVILDKQILTIRDTQYPTLLNDINLGNNATQIGITINNVEVYVRWCDKCREISQLYYNDEYRAVDIERGFFTLVQRGNVDLAAEILSMA